MEEQLANLSQKLKSANNVLITVPKNPNVDQLAAAIGLTLIVNKLGKHGSAVYSGSTPSTIGFLNPDETIEKSTDSLRDFIISLDRNKADKLRYKVEDDIVKIFITPYRTSISEADLVFSQGDFNVDLVVALGLTDQKDLDDAIVSHGRILHDAAIACVNIDQESNFGTINYLDKTASSLCELVYIITKGMIGTKMDGQTATALLTGVVAETERFSNEKTSSRVMTISGELISAGANQQLVASSLHTVQSAPPPLEPSVEKSDPTTISINHDKPASESEDIVQAENQVPTIAQLEEQAKAKNSPTETVEAPQLPEVEPSSEASTVTEIPSSEGSSLNASESDLYVGPDSKFITEAPVASGQLTANTKPEGYDPTTDPLSNVSLPGVAEQGIIDKPKMVVQPEEGFTPPPPGWKPQPAAPSPDPAVETTPPAETIAQIEKENDSPHTQDTSHIDNARSLVDSVVNESSNPTDSATEPIAALNAMPAIENINGAEQDVFTPEVDLPKDNNEAVDSTSPPPVPPPIPLNTNNQDNKPESTNP